MDNPQYYQPLSHALNPPYSSSNSRSAQYQSYNSHANTTSANAANGAANNADDDEEEEEEDVVEEELAGNTRRADGNNAASPEQNRQTGGQSDAAPAQQQQQPAPEPPKPAPDPSTYAKRRPGRPKGSKTKRATQPTETVAPTYAGYYPYAAHAPLHPTGTGTAPPLHPSVNEGNQQYYEFQWRVLNLCSEFYGAAEELVKATPPLVLAQCYTHSPTSPVDPISMLNEAKKHCDILLANPSWLIHNPPPPIMPVMPIFHTFPQPPLSAQATSTPTTATSQAPPSASVATTSTTTSTPATTISNPQSFVMSLSGAAAAQSAGYPTRPYYQYSGAYQPQATYYTTTAASGVGSSTTANPSLSAGAGGGPATGGNSGTWSDEETERLKKLAEQSKSTGSSGEIEWDWVINQWGNSRTRHQILIKATNLGLKESSGRGVKRRRETESGAGGTASPAPATNNASVHHDTSSTSAAPPSSTTSTFQVTTHPAQSVSPVHSHTASTPASAQPSPALHHPQPHHQTHTPVQSHAQPHNTQSHQTSSSASHMPWPMPTVASTTSPVIATSEPPRGNYYRNRGNPSQSPSISTSKPPSGAGVTHQYMYQPSGGQRK